MTPSPNTKQPSPPGTASAAAGPGWSRRPRTARLVLEDGQVIEGFGIGATGIATAELCFNTAMTGYQEILTDPSYAGQIIVFTFPHIGNVGTNDEDDEDASAPAARAVRGCVLGTDITAPSNYRAGEHLGVWLEKRGIIAITGIDTRALTTLIRERGFINATIAHDRTAAFDIAALKQQAAAWPGLEGMDLASEVSCREIYAPKQTPWRWNDGFGALGQAKYHVVALDYGIKRDILRLLADVGAAVTVVPATTGADEILALKPDGIFLANGPGDPAATGAYAVATIRTLVDSGLPLFGICLGHQMLALALGAKTVKMHQGHHGANHPVKDHTTGKVEITSMNHGFAVDSASLPAGVTETHVSLFDGSNCGLSLDGKPVFSVQHHPEASPGPQDSHYLFERFADLMEKAKS